MEHEPNTAAPAYRIEGSGKVILEKVSDGGRTVRVEMEIDAHGSPIISAHCEGVASASGYSPVGRAARPIMLGGRRVCGLIGRYAFYEPEARKIEAAIEAARKARDARGAAIAAQPVHAERAAVDDLYERAYRRKDWPGEYHQLRMRAEDALAAWRAKYPEAAAAEDMRRKIASDEREAQKRRDYESSFIARGLD